MLSSSILCAFKKSFAYHFSIYQWPREENEYLNNSKTFCVHDKVHFRCVHVNNVNVHRRHNIQCHVYIANSHFRTDNEHLFNISIKYHRISFL